MLTQFAEALAQNSQLLRYAETGGNKITPEEWNEMCERFLAQLDTVKADMGLAAPELTDESVPQAQREALAAAKVEAYFDRLNDGKSRLRPLPSALATLLRARLPSRVNDAGLARALELVKEKSGQDTTDAPGSAIPPGVIQPAPGPAPVPGAGAPGAAPGSGNGPSSGAME
jgi:hypothetical protein